MAKGKKYDYNKELIPFTFLKPPVVLPALPVIQFFMKAFYPLSTKDKQLVCERLSVPVTSFKKIRALVYTPKELLDKETPAIIFYHGGGFVFNAAPHHFTLAKNLAKQLGVRVFFVDYRLAPGNIFPAAAQDSFYSYRYILENASRFKVDKNRIALCGDSAGGNLSAVVCIMARDAKLTPPCAQVLIYPFVDDDLSSDSMKEYTDTPMCNTKDVIKYRRAYVGKGECEPKKWFSAVDAENLCDLPDALIETAEFDCLHDGGVKYYEKLKEAGNKALLFETKGTMHGYDIATKSSNYAECMKNRTDFLRKAFEKREQQTDETR